ILVKLVDRLMGMFLVMGLMFYNYNVQTTLLRRYLFQLSLVVYSKHFLPFGIIHLLSPFLYTSVHLQFVLVEFAYLSSFNLLYLTNHDWSVYNMFYLLFS